MYKFLLLTMVLVILVFGCDRNPAQKPSNQSNTENPVSTTQTLKPEFSLTANVIGGDEVEFNVTTNIPGKISMHIGFRLDDPKYEDIATGAQRLVYLEDGQGSFIVKAKQYPPDHKWTSEWVPPGNYIGYLRFSVSSGLEDEKAKSSGITENVELKIHIPAPLKGNMSFQDFEDELDIGRRQDWAVDGVYSGMSWDIDFLRKNLGDYIESVYKQ